LALPLQRLFSLTRLEGSKSTENMKKLFIIIGLCIVATPLLAQSRTFQTLKNKFRGQENVLSFSASGLFARTALWLSGEHDFRDAIRNVKSVRLITIPKQRFEEAQVTVGGLRKLAREDSFEEMLRMRDHGDDVTILVKNGKKQKLNRYFLLLDDSYELVAIEIKGYIDAERLRNNTQSIINDSQP
jgi:hypothetical protein